MQLFPLEHLYILVRETLMNAHAFINGHNVSNTVTHTVNVEVGIFSDLIEMAEKTGFAEITLHPGAIACIPRPQFFGNVDVTWTRIDSDASPERLFERSAQGKRKLVDPYTLLTHNMRNPTFQRSKRNATLWEHNKKVYCIVFDAKGASYGNRISIHPNSAGFSKGWWIAETPAL